MNQLMSLSKIFSEKLFRIPDYQRGYAWTLKEIEEFWEDLCRLEPKHNHYIGVLTLEPAKEKQYKSWTEDIWLIESKMYNPFYVVDGQQRLTTAIILIYVLVKIMKEKDIPYLNYTSSTDIMRKYIFDIRDSSRNRSYLYGYEIDNPSYSFLIKNIFEESIVSDGVDSETIYTMNLEAAKTFFYDKLCNMQVAELESVYTKITQHFLFNMYVISEDIDVYVTFETMNNRGKPLSGLELLKNRLIYISTLLKVEENEKNRLRKRINTCWKKIYHIIGETKSDQSLDDDFLLTHFMYYFADKFKEIERKHGRYYNLLTKWQCNYLMNDYFVVSKIYTGELTIEQCFDYIDSVSDAIELWGIIETPYNTTYSNEIKEAINRLNFFVNGYFRMRFSRYDRFGNLLKVFALTCIKHCKDDESLSMFLNNFEKYLFCFEFYRPDIDYTFEKKEIDYLDLILKLNTYEYSIENVIYLINREYNKLIEDSDLSNRVYSYYNKRGFADQSWLKYFLIEYEQSLMKKSKSHIMKINYEIIYKYRISSLEHIYPRNARTKYWVELFSAFDSKEKEKLRNSLGNFVLVSSEKNGKLANKSFPEKKSNKENPVGYKYGTYSEIELTEYDDWDCDAILKRGLKLLDFMHERWGIKFYKKSQKQNLLGLDFLERK